MSSVVAISQAGSAATTNWVESAIAESARRQARLKLSSAVKARIEEACQVWGKLLFPTPKLESWKYTNPEAIAQGPFCLGAGCGLDSESGKKSAQELLEQATIAGLNESCRLVFVDGMYAEALSTITTSDGIAVTRLADAATGDGVQNIGMLGLHTEEPFAALATALLSDAVCISVARGREGSQPIHIIHLSTPASEGSISAPRLLLQAAESSRVVVVESHVGAAGVRYLSLPVAEIRAEANAHVEYYKIQSESTSAYHVSGTTVEQHRDAQVQTHIFSFGGALVRNNAQVLLKGSNTHAVLNGLSLLAGKQHVDNSTLIHHIEPSAESREHFKGIYAGESRGVFSGTITVEKIAQKTNAFQSNQALLLSPDAGIESRPQLKIWADDVKCTHGATVGQLDPDAMFYLQSRGISKEAAKAFLVHAFASEVLTSVQVTAVKEHVESLISHRLEQ
jgi:Fe-S cluster assembly protein SufD